MPWEAWTLVALYVAAMFAVILTIGEPREPSTPGSAALSVVLTAFLCYLVIRLGVR